jgi:hypothetical protein
VAPVHLKADASKGGDLKLDEWHIVASIIVVLLAFLAAYFSCRRSAPFSHVGII